MAFGSTGESRSREQEVACLFQSGFPCCTHGKETSLSVSDSLGSFELIAVNLASCLALETDQFVSLL